MSAPAVTIRTSRIELVRGDITLQELNLLGLAVDQFLETCTEQIYGHGA